MPLKSSSFTMRKLKKEHSDSLFQTRSLRSMIFGEGDDNDIENPTLTEETYTTDTEELLHFWNELCASEPLQEAEGRASLISNDKSSRSRLSQNWCESQKTLGASCQSLCLGSATTIPTTNKDDLSQIVPCISIDEARDASIGALFDRLDLDQDGLLDRKDLEAMLLDAAATIKLKVDPSVIDAAIDALIEDTESDEALRSQEVSYIIGDFNTSQRNCSIACIDADSINKAQFSDIFKRHPDMLRALLPHDSATVKPALRPMSKSERRVEQEENEQIWQTRWKNWRITVVWLVLYVLANMTAFTIKAMKYAHHEYAQDVFGPCILIARGAAQCLNLNCAFILLPVGRHFITRLRATRVRFYFPFDAIREVHKLLGAAILFWTVVHVGAHMADFYMFSRADELDIYELVQGKLGVVPQSPWGRWKLLLGTRAGITGVMMVFCILVAYPMIHFRRRYFNAFWTTHHLLIVMLIALCFHGTGELLEKSQSVWWLMVPLGLYLIPRFLRESYCSQTSVIDAKVKKGGVLCLRLQKPAHWGPFLESGMYAFVHVPSVSRFEWHPFTLTSSKNDPYLEFHIRNAGDWTSKFHQHVQAMYTRQSSEDFMKSFADVRDVDVSCDTSQTGKDSTQTISEDSMSRSTDDSYHSRCMMINDSMHSSVFGARYVPPPEAIRNMVVKVEGPIGASSQGFKDYPIVVLVGAGIGVTPMISVLKELLHNPGQVQRVFFYWTVRDRAAFEWFSDLMDRVYRHDKTHVLQVRHFLTSVKDDNRDIGAVLLHHATRTKHRADGFDLILGQQTHHQVAVGRPNWNDELKSVKQEAKDLGQNKCGIFLCGPERMAQDLSDVSMKFSRRDPDFHFHFNKETF